jgi:hypothetical protein
MQASHATRRLVAGVTTGGLTALLLFASIASAASTRISVNASLKPTKPGSPAHPVGVTAAVAIDVMPLSTAAPPATSEVDIFLPKALRTRGSQFPSCSTTTMASSAGLSACPAGSQIGTGSASGTALGLTEQLGVKVFNGPGGKSIILYLSGTTPLSIGEPVVGSMGAPSSAVVSNPADFSSELSFLVPDNLLHPIPGATVAVTHISVAIGAARKIGRKTIHYFESVGTPSAVAESLLFL